jgi:2-oxo-4-hydroxy-4-carboxy-5-ureidoimidazoline decarboxylase
MQNFQLGAPLSQLELAEFNKCEPDQVNALLTTCLAVPRWVDAVLAGRPFDDVRALLAASEAATPLLPAEIHEAMAAHPRIGEKATGSGTGASWSRSEQSGVDGSTAERFQAANVEYEQRFGHVFLVCASGRSGEELLANLRGRLGNDPDTELTIAGQELAKIAQSRLEKAVKP